MKKIQLSLVFACFFIVISCKKKEEKVEEATPVAVEEPAPPVFKPFNIILIQHELANYDKWRTIYDSHDSIRKSYGITHYHIGRDDANPNFVYIFDIIEDVMKAKDFTKLPDLKVIMKKGGVKGMPKFNFLNVTRIDSSKIDQKERLKVTHKVKDFDAWLKVYDQEGTAKRLEEGLIDRALARDIDDPNIVTIVFAITDKEKAKKSITSEEKKTLMTEAGVEGKPEMVFYTLTDK